MTARRWLAYILVAVPVTMAAVLALVWWQDRGLQTAEQRLQAGDPRAALAAVHAYLNSHPGHGRATRLQARALLEMGKPDEALRLFGQVGADQPDDLRAWGKAHMQLGQLPQALQIFESLQELEAPNAETLEMMTFCQYELGMRDAALDSAQRLAALPGQEAVGQLQLALLHRDWGDTAQALKHFQAVLQHAPDADGLRLQPAEFYLAYAVTSLAAGDARRTLELADTSQQLAPSPGALLLQAEAWQALGDTAKADVLRRQLIARYPEHPAALRAAESAQQGAGSQATSDSLVAEPKPLDIASTAADRSFDDGHARMRHLLDEIRRTTADQNPYLGDRPVRELQERLAGLPSDADAAARFGVLNELAVQQLQIGQTEPAIRRFHECLALVPDGAGDLASRVEYQLAVAYLRRAENENCVHCANGESCILPIRGGGIHENKSGSQNAIKYLTSVLERNPGHVAARWLLNLAYMTLGAYPDDVPETYLIAPERFEAEEDAPRFENIAQKLSLDENGLCGGIVVDDLNGDHWLDVITSQWSTSGQLRCYLSQRDGTFRETTGESGLEGIYGGLNLLQADYDNDGDVDILVLRGGWWGQHGRHPNSLLENDGSAHFRDVTFEAGLGDVHYPTQTASWADYDNDGDLDLFIGNEDFPCQLFENDGRGRFQDVAEAAGVNQSGYVKGVIWGDYDGDRFPDLYVSNLNGPNQLFHNNGDRTFTDVAVEVGVERPSRSFPTWFWDYNNDGALDLYVAGYSSNIGIFAADFLGLQHQGETDRLYQGDGKGSFRDVSQSANVARITVPMGSNFGDWDNDGFLDHYLGTGDPNYDALMPNRMFHNQNGERFADVSTASGFAHLQKGHGVAFADFDHDGDQDVFIVMGGAYPGDAFPNAVFENPGFGNNWIAVKLLGETSNRMGVGARIRAVVEEKRGEQDGGEQDGGEQESRERSIYRWVNSGGSFGANPLRTHLGLGDADKVKRLEVYWPTSDVTQVFYDVPAGRMIQVVEGAETWEEVPLDR